MAISSYTELQAAIASELNRTDLTPKIPEFIAFGEALMRKDERLRGNGSITRGTLSVSSQFTALPAGFRGFLSITATNAGRAYTLDQVSEFEIDDILSCEPTGLPRAYCINGTDLEVAPVPSSATTLNYSAYISLTPLATTATNWMLTSHPDIYFYAALIHSAPYLHEDERAAVWNALYDQRCDLFAQEERNRRFSAAPLNKRKRSIG
jgi:hypothetical protein